MIRYVPSSAAAELTEKLWDLARPPSVRSADDTSAMFPFVTDTMGKRWLVVNTEFAINVHPAAELNGIADILRPWIDGGQLPADTLANLNALLDAKRGQRLVVWDAFPKLFQDMSKTHPEMIAAGLLAEPTMP